jgi:hypothetical protein
MYGVAKKMKVPYSTIRDVTHQLEYLNEIRRWPGSSSTCISWESPNPLHSLPTVEDGEKTLRNGGYVPFLEGDVDKNNPEMCRVHTSGEFGFKVLAVGSMEGRILDENENIVGDWTHTSRPRGRTDHKGMMYMFGQVVNFVFREGNKGSQTLAVWPKEVWVHGSEAAEKGKVILTSRAIYVTQLLRKYGWRVSEPELRGKIHYAFNNPALASKFKKDTHIEGADVYVDTSPGDPEVETENEADVNILAFLPTHIRGIKASLNAIDAKGDTLLKEVKELRVQALESEKFLLERQITAYEIIRRQPETEEVMRPTKKLNGAEAMYQ